MAPPVTSTPFELVVEVTAGYLGPAAERFISRQVTNHLHKRPEDLSFDDLRRLIDWLKLSMAFLTSDEKVVARYVAELKAIAPAQAGRPGRTKSHASF